LFITHDLGVVAQIADKVAVMQQGEIVEQGVHSEVLYNPQHPYTISLLGALPENLQRQPIESVNTEVMLEARNLKVWFPVRRGLLRRIADHVRAVDDVSVKIHKGEIVALVGESGSGKSTLGRAMVRLIEPTAGEIYYREKEIGNLSAKEFRGYRTDLQVVFQDPLSSLNPRLTIATTLTEPMKVHGIGESHEHRIELAAKLMEDVQLTRDYLWRYPHEFSGGQRQRISIARALASEPEFIICDEPTSALDVSVQAQVLNLLKQLQRELGLTYLFITHDLAVVSTMARKIGVLQSGRLVEEGDTVDLLKNPSTEYTKMLIDSAPRL